jgi:hypothetical protein
LKAISEKRCDAPPILMTLYLSLFVYSLVLLVLPLQISYAVESEGPISTNVFEYDASVGFLDAGTLTLELTEFKDKYEVLGRFESSRALSKYYTWNGVFAAKGHWEEGARKTDGYFVRSEGSDDHFKMVILSEREARLLEGIGEEFETIARPGGTDLISGLFFGSGCYKDELLHDGEDSYPVKAVKIKSTKLVSTDLYVSGKALECTYQVSDRKQRRRKIYVTQTQHQGTAVAAKIRIAISFFPDPTFRLRRQYSTN